MLNKDDKAPEFTLPDQNEHDLSLSSLIKDGPAILYFYPADFTPGCTREACTIRDMHREISRVGLTVAGRAAYSRAEQRWAIEAARRQRPLAGGAEERGAGAR